MTRLLVEIINFIGCLIGGLFSPIAFALVAVCIAAALLAWLFFSIANELYEAHSPKEGSS